MGLGLNVGERCFYATVITGFRVAVANLLLDILTTQMCGHLDDRILCDKGFYDSLCNMAFRFGVTHPSLKNNVP